MKDVLQKIREHLALLLIILLPFHAFAVTVLTKLIAGPNHAPLPQLSLWKEALLGLILCFAIIEWLRNGIRNGKWKIENGKLFDGIDLLIIGLGLLAIVVSIFNSEFSIQNFALGAKYDFIPLVAFLMLRRVPWSDWFKRRVFNDLMIASVFIAAYGILTLFLSDAFFTSLGYSNLHSLYVPDGPIAAFQQIGGTALHRIQSTMSGPNQLGLWLLIPYAFYVPYLFYAYKHKERQIGAVVYHSVFSVIVLIAIALTFSRAAWIGVVVITILSAGFFAKESFRKIALVGGGILAAGLIALFLFAPSIITRVASSRDHIARPIAAIQQMIAHPFGQGLGTAGPATNRTGDACVYLEEGADASWAKDQPNLCVFVGESQVQPATACNCPFLPENWYLQIGVELGWVGMILYIILALAVMRRLYLARKENSMPVYPLYTLMIALSIAALFLHAWEDTAVAYTVWILAALSLSSRRLAK